MKILVTGANGFIGKHLVKKLRSENHDVVCHEISDGDISEKGALEKYKNIDYVYHLAACTYVPSSWDYTYDYFRTNILGTVTVLEYCRKNKCAITAMSTYVYGEPQYLPIDENHPISAASPYHESKIVVEELCKFYSEKFNITTTIFRPFNVYGNGQNESFLLPKIMKQILDPEIKEIQVMDLEPKRDFVYIDDVVEALIYALRRKGGYSVYNIGSGVSISVEEAIILAMQVTGIYKPYKATEMKRRGEISDCVSDISKIRSDLGFIPFYSLKDGLKKWMENINNTDEII